jgi:2-iminobutanoate/2-iminopropanoate deaminase
MQKIATKEAPEAIGPYSQAILVKDFLFISGQLPIAPSSGKLVGSTIEEQTKQVLANLAAILKAAGCSLEHVVRTEVFLQDLTHFPFVNQIYGEFFTGPIKPARQTIQAAKLPMGALIEISCIAHCAKEKA